MELVEVARRLLLSKTATECLKILEELLLNHGARYRPLGDIPGNHGAVEVGGDADSAMIERGTNAIDAIRNL